MGRTAKISISLPVELMREVEQTRIESQETRSDFFRRAAETVLRAAQVKEAEARYVQGYIDHPETEEEMELAYFGARMLAEAQW